MTIRLFKPCVGSEELEAVRGVFERSWLGLGERVEQFENAWCEHLGCSKSVAVNSATAALHLSLSLFRFPVGKKVLVPSMTFAASANAALYNRLEPLFIDSDDHTLGLDLEDLDRKYTKDCVAVIPVHYAGHPVQMNELVSWARHRNLKIIEDCAHTSGSTYLDVPLGRWGDLGCFSFEEKKIMTTGDGGMISGDDEDLMAPLKAKRWVGIDKDNWKRAAEYTEKNADARHWYYEINLLGYKYNMNDLAACIGLCQLQKLSFFFESRRSLIKRYLQNLGHSDRFKPLVPYEPDSYNYQMFGLRCDRRDELMIFLKNSGIATGCHYTPLHMQPLYKVYTGYCPFIEREQARCITLPLYPDLEIQEVDYICDRIHDFYK